MSLKLKISSFTIIVAFLSVALAGLTFIPLLPIKLSPSRTLPSLTVSYSMPNNSSRVIEMEVTSRLEAMLARIRGINSIKSTSSNGWGRITLEFDKHTNIDAARFEASTIIRQTWPSLPDGLSYPAIQMNRPDDSDERSFMTYTINASATPIIIHRMAEEQIKPRIASLSGVYRVDVTGGTPMEWRLEYDSRQLTTHGVTVSNIQQAISNYYNRSHLGVVANERGENNKEWIRLTLTPEADSQGFDPSKIAVANGEGKIIRLDQLLTVTREEEAPQSYYRINGLNSVYVDIYADEMANQLDLATLVKSEMADIITLLPSGYEVHTRYDATEYIQKELNKIYIRTGLTVLILLLFVLLITRNFRYLFLITISLIVNLSIAVILYYLLKLEIQLYSLAGITISLSLIIDNTIVMTDHIRNRHDRGAFLAILTATVTTIGALSMIFFLDEQLKLNLQDFAAVVIINLAVSLFIALFLVPALIEKMNLLQVKKKPADKIKTARFVKLRRFFNRFPVWFTNYYEKQIRFLMRWRTLACLVLVLVFGLPLFMIPEKIELEEQTKNVENKDSRTEKYKQSIDEWYNETMANPTRKETVRPAIDKGFGGTLRLFVQKVYSGSYFTRSDEIVLSVVARLPNGSTLDQMDHLIRRMEAYLSTFKDIKQFQTRISNARQANISIYFTEEAQRSGFPYTLNNNIISKALELGGGSWTVSGLPQPGSGFNNDLRESAGNYRILMYGYNYDELYAWAEELREQLITNYRRIREVLINSEYSYYKDDYQEFYFNLNKERLAQEQINPTQLFSSIYPVFLRNSNVGSIVYNNENERLKLYSRQAQEYDIWNMQYTPQYVNRKAYKLSELATVEKEQTPQNVVKENQQYMLYLQYDYIGSSQQGNRVQDDVLKEMNARLPIGYAAEKHTAYYSWQNTDNRQYLLLALVIIIIFFTTSILFNSLKQPLAIIFVIPISYIGVFLTFYWFRLNFDQGGFASFVLLCGITINASIYIINEFNQLRIKHPLMPPMRLYLKAWNAKIVPIFLTVVSTVLGFIPFMVGISKEAFWFPLAAGTIGGLIMSVIGIFFFLPLFALKREKRVKREKIKLSKSHPK
jgi:multidrug efflux pump subunit AcrB